MLEMDYSFRIYDGAIILFKDLILLYINTESCLSALPHNGVFQHFHGVTAGVSSTLLT